MLVTINTDASFHLEHRWGGYAFVAVSNAFRIKHAGPLRAKMKAPHDAEMRCILNALHVVLKRKGISRIIVNTDCLNAVHVFTNDKSAQRRWMGSPKNFDHYREKFNLIFKTNGYDPKIIEFRHVKAHNGTPDARSHVNEWCDTEAKRRMWGKVGQSVTK